MASLTPTGLETITYGQQGWNAIVTANMQRLNTWLGKLLPLMDSRSRTAGAVPVWNAAGSRPMRCRPCKRNWRPSSPAWRRWRQRRKSRLPPRIKAVPERSGAAFAI